MSRPDLLPRPADPLGTAAFVAARAGRVVAYLDELTTPDRALRAAAEAFADLRGRLAAGEASDVGEASDAGETSDDGQVSDGDGGRAVEAALVAATRAAAERLLADPAADGLSASAASGPDRALDRAEAGFRRGREVPLDGTEVGVLATAMLLGNAPAPARRGTATTAASGADVPPARRARRTAVPPPPAATGSGETDAPADDGPARPPAGRTIVGARRTLTVSPAPESVRPASATPEVDRPPSAADSPPPEAAGAASSGPPVTGLRASDAPTPDETSAPEAPPKPDADATPSAGRSPLQSAVVRQLGVPALLLLAVVVAALIATGALGGGDEPGPPVTRPGLPTVPGDPRAIPPLP